MVHSLRYDFIFYRFIALQFRTGSDFQSREIICTLLFLRALFVLIVSTLSLQTTRDIKRIYALEIENITDPLMNISNRHYLDRKLQEEFSKAERYNLVLFESIEHLEDSLKQDNMGRTAELMQSFDDAIIELTGEN